MYKTATFRVCPPYRNKPIVLDDTAYFIPCKTPEQAKLLNALLNSEPAKNFFEAFTFWDAKRPITVDLLSRLDLRKLANEQGVLDQFSAIFRPRAAEFYEKSLF